ncbi:hypothetical protein [Veillonella seminalis]|uniref:hypothetical protein n=1 Tax=Veillonella seminalis TaxID=1502943 RepID=UPI003080A0A4
MGNYCFLCDCRNAILLYCHDVYYGSFFDYKPDVIYKFMPLGISLGSSMLSAGVIGAVIALVKAIVDVDHNGIPDEFENGKDDKK